jgi:diguanylate cyclase (GGDEF)-like protein
MVSVTELLVCFIYLLNLLIRKNNAPALQFMSVALFTLDAFLIPNRWKNCVFSGCAILAVYLIFCSFFEPLMDSLVLAQQGVYLGICLLACSAFVYTREKSEREHFAAEQLLEFMAITDRLTGIYNRGRFDFVLNAWIKNARHDPFCLLLFDIDDFKKVNDRCGHLVGDEALISTSKVVIASIRDNDIFARWGGEEFVILFSRVKIDKAVELAERLRAAIEVNSCGEAGNITISIGVAEYRRGESVLDLVRRADTMMYRAKERGKNQVIADVEPALPS